jgi:tRNA(Arg) A34 adenosine deaminase TadA
MSGGDGADRRLMRRAVETARRGIREGQTPFGACVVRDGRVVAAEHNVVWGTTDVTAHAEIQALRRACRELDTVDLSGCEIYTTCEPCPMCFAACHWARLDRIVFGARIEDAREAGFSELEIPAEEMKRRGESPVELRGGVEHQACVDLFRAWKERPDSRPY